MKLQSSFYLAATLAFFAGWQTSQWYAHRNQPVHAQSDTVLYQFENVSGASAVTLYYPNTRTIYVYPSVAVGNNIIRAVSQRDAANASERAKRWSPGQGSLSEVLRDAGRRRDQAANEPKK